MCVRMCNHMCACVYWCECECVCVCVCVCNVYVQCVGVHARKKGKEYRTRRKEAFHITTQPQKSKPKAVHFQSNFSAGIDTGTNGAEFINFL